MYIILCVLLFLSVVKAQDDDVVQIIGPDRVQELYSCVGSSTYIPWPLNVVSRRGHESTVISLIFQRRHSERRMPIASFNGQQDLKTDSSFKDRMSVSSENSGVFLEQTSMDDAGTYTAQARMSNGQVWTRTTNLTVLLRPIVYSGRLNISKSELSGRSSGKSHCVNVTCGTLEYAGYPPATLVWTTPTKILSMKTATDDFSSSVVICAPYLGDVTCSIAGFSSVCTYDHMASLYLDLPDPSANGTGMTKSLVSQDLALTIIMPILAVLVPLAILGVWVLSHILKSHPQYREDRRFGAQAPQVELDIEENGMTEQTHDVDGYERDSEEREMKMEVQDGVEDKELTAAESNHVHNHHDAGIEDGNDHDEDDEEKTNEGRPLMQATIGTAV